MFVLVTLLCALTVSAYDGKTSVETKVSLKGSKSKLLTIPKIRKDSHRKKLEAATYGTITSGWMTTYSYTGTTCSTSSTADSIPLGVCIQDSATEWYSDSATLTGGVYTLYENSFSDSACSVYNGNSFSGTYGTSTCATDGSYSDQTSTGGLPSAGNNVVINSHYTTSTCTGTLIEQILVYPSCVSFSAGSSDTYTCSGSSFTGTAYATDDCTGTSTTSTVTGNTCTAAGEGSYVYQYISCGSSSSSSCFAGSETVTMESGETKLISEVSVGDRVLAYSTKTDSAVYSDVISVPHAENTVRAAFTQISTAEKAIKLTEDHLLQAGSCSAGTFELTRAGDVKVGDCINTVSGAQSVVSVAKLHAEGIYTVVTNEEYVIVSDVVASPFAVNHFIVNKFYNIHRALYNFAPYSMKSAFLAISNGIARQVAKFSTSA